MEKIYYFIFPVFVILLLFLIGFSLWNRRGNNLEFLTPETKTFEYTGKEQIYTVPENCNKLQIEMSGGGGGTPSNLVGYIANPGTVSGSLKVEPGAKLYMNIGGKGGLPDGGYNGGGRGYTAQDANVNGQFAYGGGGATHIAEKSGLLKDLKNNKSSVLLVAGGGGGMVMKTGEFGWNADGGNGGFPEGQNGQFTWTNSAGPSGSDGTAGSARGQNNNGPTGGTQTEGGMGSLNYNGRDGFTIAEFGEGATGYNNAFYSNNNQCNEGKFISGIGGGGGGYYGGGAGSGEICWDKVFGGGGGSSYVDNEKTTNVTHGTNERGGNGYIKITPILNPTTTTTTTTTTTGISIPPLSKTFNYTGNIQEWQVPGYVTEVVCKVYGASGGGGVNGGKGGVVLSKFTVTPKQKLYIAVGGQGSTDIKQTSGSDVWPVGGGGYNGGGNGQLNIFNDSDQAIGGGGGASHIAKTSGILKDVNKEDLYVVAGGGGGGNNIKMYSEQNIFTEKPEYITYNIKGGDAGNPNGKTGSTIYYNNSSEPFKFENVNNTSAGTGGTQTEGGYSILNYGDLGMGNLPSSIYNLPGLNRTDETVQTGKGSYGQGGSAYSPNWNATMQTGLVPQAAAGGGGGGYYGGGGGNIGSNYRNKIFSGGGGGSSYVNNSLVTYSRFGETNVGNGKVEIYYNNPPTTTSAPTTTTTMMPTTTTMMPTTTTMMPTTTTMMPTTTTMMPTTTTMMPTTTTMMPTTTTMMPTTTTMMPNTTTTRMPTTTTMMPTTTTFMPNTTTTRMPTTTTFMPNTTTTRMPTTTTFMPNTTTTCIPNTTTTCIPNTTTTCIPNTTTTCIPNTTTTGSPGTRMPNTTRMPMTTTFMPNTTTTRMPTITTGMPNNTTTRMPMTTTFMPNNTRMPMTTTFMPNTTTTRMPTITTGMPITTTHSPEKREHIDEDCNDNRPVNINISYNNYASNSSLKDMNEYYMNKNL